jgi:hypothetical protein
MPTNYAQLAGSHDLVWKDQVYCDIAFCRLDEHCATPLLQRKSLLDRSFRAGYNVDRRSLRRFNPMRNRIADPISASGGASSSF